MQYRYLGRTGVKVSALCLGTITFGRETQDETAVSEMLNLFQTAGGNFIDTAGIYGNGESEAMLGRWLSGQPRDAYVIATKVFGPHGSGPNDVGLSRKHILTSVETSLRRLQTDYIDLLQLHSWDEGTPLEEVLSTLNALVQSGKVRYIGASNFAAWQLQKAVDTSRANGWEAFCSLQPLYNLLDRDIELDIVPVCQNEGLGIMVYSPLQGGWLSGKYQRGMSQPLTNTRIADNASQVGGMDLWAQYNTEQTWNVIDVLTAVAEESGKTPAQVALRWVVQQAGVTAAIVGARDASQLQDNLGAVGWELSPEQVSRLTAANPQIPRYPYNVLQMAVAFRKH